MSMSLKLVAFLMAAEQTPSRGSGQWCLTGTLWGVSEVANTVVWGIRLLPRWCLSKAHFNPQVEA